MLPRSYLLAILAGARFVTAQTLPACANYCLAELAGSGQIKGCSSLDLACLCSNRDFLTASVCCLHANCSDSDREAAEDYSRTNCKAAGAPIPTGITCPTLATSSSDGSAKETGSSSSGTSDDDSSQNSTSDSQGSGSGSDSGSSGSGGSQSSSSKKKKSKSSLTTGLGAGLGAGIPILASLVGAIFLYLRKSKKKQANTPPPQMPVQQVPQGYIPPSGPAFQGQTPVNYTGQTPVNYTYPNNGYTPPPGPPTQIPVVYEKDGVVMTGVSPANPAELASEYRQHNELAGSTPQPVHELPHYPQHTAQGQ